MDVRIEMRDVSFQNGKPLGTQLLESGLHVNRIPQDDHIDHQSERAQLVFLAFAIALTELTTLAVENDATQARGAPRRD